MCEGLRLGSILELLLWLPSCVALGKALPSLVMTPIVDTNIRMGGTGVEEPGGYTLLGSCACRKLSSQRCRQSGEGGWRPEMHLQIHLTRADGKRGRMLRHPCAAPLGGSPASLLRATPLPPRGPPARPPPAFWSASPNALSVSICKMGAPAGDRAPHGAPGTSWGHRGCRP